MARYRTTPTEFEAILQSPGELWEQAILKKISDTRLPDHSQDHLPLSDCCIGTFDWPHKGGGHVPNKNVISDPLDKATDKEKEGQEDLSDEHWRSLVRKHK